MSKVNMPSLLEEPPIVLYPSLAKALGVNQAAIFQQLHYLLTATKVGKSKYNLVDGKWWVYNTYEEWQEYFIWLSVSAIKQMFLALEDLGIVVSQQGVKKATDRRKWYTIDYDAWQKFRESIGQNLSDDETKNVPSMNGQNLSDDYTDNIDSTDTIATDVAPPKKSGHPLNCKNESGRNPYYDTILIHSFGANPESKADTDGLGGRVGPVLAALKPLYDEIDGFTPEQLAAAYRKYRQMNPNISMPRDAGKVYAALAPLLRQPAPKAILKTPALEQFTRPVLTDESRQRVKDEIEALRRNGA